MALTHHHYHGITSIPDTTTQGLHSGAAAGGSIAPITIMMLGQSKQKQIIQGIVCIACMAFCIWLVMFLALVLLLHTTNTEPVHSSCPGVWDFVLISLLLPFISPCLYLCTPVLSLASLLFLSLLGILITMHSSTMPTCVETLREITPPLPWLLFIAWIKTVLYMAAALSALLKLYRTRSVPSA